MKFTPATVRQVADQARDYTAGVVEFGHMNNPGDGMRYCDGLKQKVWHRAPYAAREAAAYYAGAGYQWATLMRLPLEEMPEVLREAARDLGGSHQPRVVRDSWAEGVETAGLAWEARRRRANATSLRAQSNRGTAAPGERRTLDLGNRADLIAWSGGREPDDLGSDVMLIDQLDGTTLVVALGRTVECTGGGYRRLESAELMAEATGIALTLPDRPIAYAYRENRYHPVRECVLPVVLADMAGEQIAEGMVVYAGNTEAALTEVAYLLGIDRGATSADRFPVALLSVTDLFRPQSRRPVHCGTCGDTLTRMPLVAST